MVTQSLSVKQVVDVRVAVALLAARARLSRQGSCALRFADVAVTGRC